MHFKIETQRLQAAFIIFPRIFPALASLPARDVIKSFQELDVADDILQYFEDNYIGIYRRNAPRRPPLFAINLWNTFSKTDDELPRTKNIVEGWHWSFQGYVFACHLVFRKFLSVLLKEENMIHISIVQHLAGHPAPPPRQRYLDSSRRILKILDDYPNRQMLHYLRAIAHDLTF